MVQTDNLIAQTIYQLPPNQPEQDACHALPLCGNSFYTPYSYTGTGKKLDLDSTPCLPSKGGGEKNSVWLQVRTSSAGNIIFTIKPVSEDDDYDFAVLDITGKSCSSLTSADVIRCNYNSNVRGSNIHGEIGLADTSRTKYAPTGSFGGSYCQPVFAGSDGTFLIMINNYGNYVSGGPSKGFTIDFSGSTASFYKTSAPELTNVDEFCNNTASIVVKTSTPVLCNSIAADGSDFSSDAPANIISAAGVNCTDHGGYTDSIVVTFSSPLPAGNYTISAKKGSDNNTLAGLCDNEMLLPAASVPFIIKPGSKVLIDNEFICYQQLPYTWNGKTISSGGDNAANFIVASADGCDSTTILNLHVSAAPQQISNTITICDGDSYSLPWGATANTAGTYTHQYTNVNGCDSVMESIVISVITPRSGNVDTRDSTIETGFCESGSALLSTGNNFINYQWNTGETSSSIIVNIAGTYSLQAMDGQGCITIDTFVVARYPFPAAAFNMIENLCVDSSLTLDAGSGFAYYLWNTGSTDQVISTDAPGTFWVALASTHNCTATDTVRVVTVQRPSNFLPPGFTKCSFKQARISPLQNFDDYQWNTGSNSSIIDVSAGGLYWLNVTDDNHCTGRDSITIKDSVCPEYFYIPNAFTPNNDGLNDVFKPKFAGTLSGYHFSIYNRWGQQVFTTTNDVSGWDGNSKGAPQAVGTYLWICSYRLNDKPAITSKGIVTLLR